MKEYKIDFKCLIGPGIVWAAGLVLIIIYAPRTVYMNGMVMLGFLALCIGTFLALYALYTEYDKTGKEWPPFLDTLFPNYPVVEDKNEMMRRLSGFRKSYSAFLASGRKEANSAIQDYATQLMWHSLALQKKRLMKKGLTLEMDSERRSYTGKGSGIRESKYFDGRYRVNDVYEEISALRTFKQGDKVIKRIKDSEVAHFTLLSASPASYAAQAGTAARSAQAGTHSAQASAAVRSAHNSQIVPGMIICPNCGNITTRENLLDGCDYCDTKFTIEDMDNRVDSFGLRRDFRTSNSKKEAVRELMFPWTTLIVMLPLIYFGLIGAFVYMPDFNIFARLVTGLLAAGLLGLLGWSLKSMFLILITPILMIISAFSGAMTRKLIYRSKQEVEQEKEMAEQVRRTDPMFSLQSFFGGVQNKLSAIHFAETPTEVNAFSEDDMTPYIERYKDVVDVDIQKMTMESYQADAKLQTAKVSAEVRLLEQDGAKIKERSERLKLRLIKDADCKTQAVCGPSVLKCKGCGVSISLMEGKTCPFCGRELDLKMYDWVIADYESE